MSNHLEQLGRAIARGVADIHAAWQTVASCRRWGKREARLPEWDMGKNFRKTS